MSTGTASAEVRAGHIVNPRQWDQVYAYALDFFNGNISRIS